MISPASTCSCNRRIARWSSRCWIAYCAAIGAIVTNGAPDSRAVEAQTIEPDLVSVAHRPLGLAWPPEVFSRPIALPFAANDPLYGIDGPNQQAGLLPIGRLSPRGERAVLTVGTDTLMRDSRRRSSCSSPSGSSNGSAPELPGIVVRLAVRRPGGRKIRCASFSAPDNGRLLPFTRLIMDTAGRIR